MRNIEFHGQSLGFIRNAPVAVKRAMGYQLDRVQRGLDPTDWKPVSQVGKGVRELRVKENGQFRVMYLAIFNQSVHVLHAFRKKTRRTRKSEMDTARLIYRKLKVGKYD